MGTKVFRGLACAMIAAAGATATADAAYPGANGSIIFERKADQFAQNSDPWNVSAGDPASARKLVKIKETALNFAYSPNGKKIAFDAEVPGQEIVVMKANGSKPKVVTKKVKKCIGKRRPAWSPDGKRIAFQCLNKKGFNEHDIWSVNAKGKDLTQVTTQHSAYDPAWSPLGDRIAYTTYGGAIYTVPASGGESTLLSEEGPGGVFGGSWQTLDWAPDGQSLVADASGDGVYTLDATTGAPSTDLADIGGEPVFSPDGSKILYVGFAESAGTQLNLWMMDADGTDKIQVTTDGYDRAPNWGVAP
jgi:Tol biopolymer transport system component